MRTLLIMRGVPGSGKSTWIEENGLKPYALCPDEIRLLCCSPLLQADGTECIGGNSENTVWKVFLQMLKERMRHGAFTVIDSTNIRAEELRRY
ncbi:MAG TPA: AAA family ATPase, partial [Candidatus Merdisoma merdipullorum]|nr:AAA family ATPase [Candidatus Merdisoma merdipullorum]